jgi:type IV secretion system protein VirB6
MNKKIRTLVLALLLQVFTAQQAVAGAGVTPDDSCVGGINLFNALVANVTTLSLFAVYSANFYIEGAPGGEGCDANYYNGTTHNHKGCAPGDNGCSSTCDSKGGMTICYKALTYPGITASNPDGFSYGYDCNEVTSGWKKTYLYPPGEIRAKKVGDKLCAQFWTIMGYQSIGCKYLPDCSVFKLDESCYVAKSCANAAFQQSRSFMPISGSIIQCIKESIERLFIDYSGCGSATNYKQNYFPVFQDTMRNVVRAALMLYVIFFGIKVALGGEMPDKGTFFTFGAKFLLVLYFSVGISTGFSDSGKAEYDDGVTTLMLPFFQDGATTLAGIVYSAGGAQGLCAYNTSDYPTEYQYLALWDSLDCRLLYYLGVDTESISTKAIGGIAITMFALGASTLLLLPLAALFAFQIIFAVFCVVFMVFLLSVVVYFVNVTVISMIALAILIYMAPIFVPMALFEQTKKYFDGWLKLIISYALQPMIVAAYIAMMLTVFDQTMFGDCQFVSTNITWSDDGNGTTGAPTKSKPFFEICDPDNPGQAGCTGYTGALSNLTPCKETLGYKITNPKGKDSLTRTTNAIFFEYTSMNPGSAENMLSSLITICLFAYLFYKFAEMLGQFAAELTGGTNLGSVAGNPMELFDKAAEMAMKKATGGDKKGGDGAGGAGGSGSGAGTAPRPGASSGSNASQGGGGT